MKIAASAYGLLAMTFSEFSVSLLLCEVAFRYVARAVAKKRKEKAMATQAQIEANRKNAQKSTGPRTQEGKETVSQNATKHGLCSCKNVIRSESQDEYNLFRNEMIADLSPVGAMEEMLAERIVSLSWRLKRAELFQNAVIESFSDDIFHERWDDCYRARGQAKEGDMSLVLGIAIRQDFANSKILEQLLIYERRIESSLYKATVELRKMQKIRREREMIDDGRGMMDESSESHPHSDKSNLPRLAASTAGQNEAAKQSETMDEATRTIDEGRRTMEENNFVKQSQSYSTAF